MSRIIISNADYPSTLASARILGKKGHEVFVADSKRFKIACYSRFAKYLECPSFSDSKQYSDWLVKQQGYFFPASDVAVWYASSRRKQMKAKTILPSEKTVNICLFKDKLDAFCRENDIGTPKTYFPVSYSDVKDISRKVNYPCLIKHRTTVGIVIEKKGQVVFSPEELVSKYRKDALAYDSAMIKKVCPDVEWPMIQEYVPGAKENMFNTVGICSRDGIRLIVGKKLRQEPPKLGIGICTTPIKNMDLIPQAKKLLIKSGYLGPFSMECIYDKRDRRYKVNDMNPRITGVMQLAVANGINIPELWYEMFSGKTFRDEVVVGDTVYLRMLADILYLPGNFLHSRDKISFLRYLLKSYLGKKQLAIFSASDIKPSLVELVMVLRNKIKHPIRYIKENITGE
ncbi:MAG: hypothetical protein HGA85_03825 [Nanoarchaeota archaeon]|nr:hypothetical protein [Nanoarchaeota archaeon]